MWKIGEGSTVYREQYVIHLLQHPHNLYISINDQHAPFCRLRSFLLPLSLLEIVMDVYMGRALSLLKKIESKGRPLCSANFNLGACNTKHRCNIGLILEVQMQVMWLRKGGHFPNIVSATQP